MLLTLAFRSLHLQVWVADAFHVAEHEVPVATFQELHEVQVVAEPEALDGFLLQRQS